MTGIATMLNFLCGIKPSYFIFISSIFLIILSYFTLDKDTTYNSVIGAILYPVLIDFVKPFCDLIAPNLSFSNIVITIIIAGTLLGIGNGAIYSLILLLISTKIVDKIIIGISTSKMFLISSKKYQKIKEYVINDMKTGVTILDTTGGFLFEKGKMLQVVVPTRSYNAFKEKILEIDSNAFIIVSDCYEVTGGKKEKKKLIF